MKVKKSTKKVLQENGYPGRYTYQDIYFFLADHWGLFINLEYHQEYQAWTASGFRILQIRFRLHPPGK